MSVCKARGCISDETLNLELTFHTFPVSDKQLLQRWIQNVAPDNFKPAPQDVICSLHFTDDQFLDTLPRTLIKCALPTLLFIDNKYISSVPENSEDVASNSNTIKDEEDFGSDLSDNNHSTTVSEVSSVSENDSDSDYEIKSPKRKTRAAVKRATTKGKKIAKLQNGRDKRARAYPRYVGDYKESDLNSPVKVKRLWDLAQNQISEQKKKLRSIQQKNRRLESQVTRLKNIIKHLKSVHR